MSLNDTALVTVTEAKSYLRANAAASLQIPAEYVGMGDGETVGFTLDNTPVSGSLKLYVNGVLQVEGTDFTLSGATITFTEAPAAVPITASYDAAAGDNTFESYDDALLEILINAATKKAEDYTGRAFIQREITETRIGDGTKILKLYKQPVTEISSITLDSDEMTDYSERLSIGRLYHLVVWTLDSEIEVTYTAGYAATRAATQALVPDAVTAVMVAVAFWYDNRLGVKSENIAGVGSVDYGEPSEMPPEALRLLDSLRVSVGIG